jgi:uncharacterized protein YjiS (DUF1127 family)
MKAQDHSLSTFDRLTQTFCEWLNHRRELNELRQLSPVEFSRVASDLQVSPADLTELGIDAGDLARVEPMVLHDMERVCALCGQKRECDRDLAAGTSGGRYQQYCQNAPTIAGLDKSAKR